MLHEWVCFNLISCQFFKNYEYRLFFKVFQERSSIVILWMGYPRKEGSKIDCYTVFKKKVSRGEVPANFNDLMAIVQEFNASSVNLTPPSLELGESEGW